MKPSEAVTTLEKGDKVELSYKDTDNELTERTGTVTKTIDGAVGGIWVNVHKKTHARDIVLKLHLVPGATVTGNKPYSSRSKRYGVKADVKPVSA